MNAGDQVDQRTNYTVITARAKLLCYSTAKASCVALPEPVVREEPVFASTLNVALDPQQCFTVAAVVACGGRAEKKSLRVRAHARSLLPGGEPEPADETLALGLT